MCDRKKKKNYNLTTQISFAIEYIQLWWTLKTASHWPRYKSFQDFWSLFFMQRKTSKMYFKNKFRYLGTKPQNSLKYIFRLICFSKTYCLLSNEVYMEWSHFLRASDFLGTFKKYFSEHLSNKYLPFQDFFMTIVLH